MIFIPNFVRIFKYLMGDKVSILVTIVLCAIPPPNVLHIHCPFDVLYRKQKF